MWLWFVSLVAVAQIGRDDDGKPEKWDKLIRSQLAPELKPLSPPPPAFDSAEVVKRMLDGPESKIPGTMEAALGVDELWPSMIVKAAMDTTEPSFKLPPGVSTPMAPSIGHMVLPLENGGYGVQNTEKNHISGVQRDAIEAAVGTMRFQDSNAQQPGFATRQHESHPRKPSYAHYLQEMMGRYAMGQPGFGVGSAPLNVMKSLTPWNPIMPFGAGPLGSGADVLGLRNSRVFKVVDQTVNPGAPYTFPPRSFHYAPPGFNVPGAMVSQFGNEVANAMPQAMMYATTIGAHPMSGIQPFFT
jgi:hypothetical protein